MDQGNQFYYVLPLALVYLVALALTLFFVFRLLIRLTRSSTRNRSEKIIALGISSLVFKSTLYDVLVRPVYLMMFNLQSLYYNLFDTLFSTDNKAASTTAFDKVDIRSVSFANIFDGYPVGRGLTFAAFFILCYYFILYLKKRWFLTSAGVLPPEKPANIFQDYPLFYNFFILSVLVSSLYIVISVFIAIPYLAEIRKPTTFTSSRLDTAIGNIQARDSGIKMVGIENSPFAALWLRESIIGKDSLAYYSIKAEASGKSFVESGLTNLQFAYDDFKRRRASVITALENMVRTYKDKQFAYRQKLVMNFEANEQSLISDRANLFQLSINAFENNLQWEKKYFYDNIRYVQSADNSNTDNISFYKTNLRRDMEDLLKRQATPSLASDTFPNYGSYQSTSYFLTDYPSLTTDFNFEDFVKKPDKEGRDWGVFGSISSYLITTRSFDLVLLMGMLGFGLLGASILSFNKENDFFRTFHSTPIIDNFGNVLARGFGAALVVYMAIKGGLTVFTGGASPDPNGYLLLLTCFIGAVFSDKIWEKAKGMVS